MALLCASTRDVSYKSRKKIIALVSLLSIGEDFLSKTVEVSNPSRRAILFEWSKVDESACNIIPSAASENALHSRTILSL